MERIWTFPKQLPHYADLLISSAGRLWVRDYPDGAGASTRFTVFESDGGVSARVEMPAQFTPTDIGYGFVTGVWRNEFDVESVRVYELEER